MKRRQRKTTFEPAAPVRGRSSIVVLYFLDGLVPSHPGRHLLLPFVQPRLSSTSTAPLPLRVPLVRHSATSPVPPAPLPQFPWAPPTVDAPRYLLISASTSCHLTMNTLYASRVPRYHFPTFLSAVDHSVVSTPNTKGASFVDPLVGRNSPRS